MSRPQSDSVPPLGTATAYLCMADLLEVPREGEGEGAWLGEREREWFKGGEKADGERERGRVWGPALRVWSEWRLDRRAARVAGALSPEGGWRVALSTWQSARGRCVSSRERWRSVVVAVVGAVAVSTLVGFVRFRTPPAGRNIAARVEAKPASPTRVELAAPSVAPQPQAVVAPPSVITLQPESSADVAPPNHARPLPRAAVPPAVTLERAAADATAAARYDVALELYRSLAASEPANAAYASMIAALERRVAAAAP
jgi:hypothetical protein